MNKPDVETAPRRQGLRDLTNTRNLGKRLLRAEWFQRSGSALISSFLALVWRTNRDTDQSTDWETLLKGEFPAIFALWHGQHILVPNAAPRDRAFVTLVSRSADAEINARVIKRAGFDVIRASGGRDHGAVARKGGVGALIAMRDALRRDVNVVMIADISKGEVRQAGEGIVRLAKISGRPIVPVALTTSRRYVLEKTWDKTTINLPFGHRCLKLAPPIRVPANAGKDQIAAARAKVTSELNRITEEAKHAVEMSA